MAINRKDFLKTMGGLAALTIIPRRVLGGPGHIAPNDQLTKGIIGMGGIANAEDAIEFILAGATAVSVGAMNFVNPYTTVEVVKGIEDYMRQYGVKDIKDLIGAVNQ